MAYRRDAAAVARETNCDAAESAFVARQLLYVESETYNTEIPPLEGRRFVPVDNKTPPGAKFTSYKKYTRTGIAKFITGRGQDLPTSGIYVQEYWHQFYPVGASYRYTLDDILAAQFASGNGGPPLNVDLEDAIGAREAIEKKLDNVARVGSADGLSPSLGLLGLLNNPNATTYVVATGLSGSQLWSQKTPDEVIADLGGIYAAQVATTFKVHKPKRILLPILQYQAIGFRSMGDGRSDTILSYFLKTRPKGDEVEIDSWQFLAGAGTGASDRMVAYDPNRRYVRHMISQEFTQLPTEYRKREYITDCIAKTAGVVMPFPLSCSYGDGI